jgi:predicted transcriptional regulator
MIWEGIELMSVVDGKKLLGVVSRQDVIKALQYLNGQPQMADTVDDIILKNFTYLNTNSGIKFRGKIAPQMLNTIGTASWNALTLMISTAGTYALRQRNHLNVAVESFTVMYTRPIQIDSIVTIAAEIIAIGRNFAKVEIEMISEDDKGLIAKGLLSTRILRK